MEKLGPRLRASEPQRPVRKQHPHRVETEDRGPAFPLEHRLQDLGVGPADTQGSSINAGPTDLESTAHEAL